ncbi:biotin/lipoate A/B protein ligase [cyanobacterium endosymbiont of Rhopalodia gibberula]|uniref:lipoate--protein ligase family protein n=1 Tax=cyanobacterium endosymbiont of Rhopalodia gibberula TaxID=1763363 RepID=UPI000DC72C8B|nr:biotin/lipoate A/B protein ligase family protein [cyanobacterium endosymbiont of Rhopalodia gibberula]BBA79780.1 biotin/lipoate A/B protein ligase [cyanobacterium endosymbiont of Rhopalodia gibberula]
MKWRLIPPIEASGMIQMAIDNWLFIQHEKGQHPPTLRFYTWSSPTISIGRLQKQWPLSWCNLTWEKRPIELVRRSTGGRAVLHQGDLTYGIITPINNRKTIDIYQQICQFLIKGWSALGIELDYGIAKRGHIHNPSCFNTVTVSDLITSDGSKLIGSAQLRGKQSVLQHGSMVLSTDKTLFKTVFNQAAPWSIGLLEQLPKNCCLETIINILIETAKQYFNINFISQPLSSKEWQDVIQLSSHLKL